MILPNREALTHKNQLLRTLRAILKDNKLSNILMFKGGTYATLRGALTRFSVDLDFDTNITPEEKVETRKSLHKLFEQLQLEVKDESQNYLQFFLKYDTPPNQRNTLKVEINDKVSQYNKYEKVFLEEVEMYCNGHTLDTMFANKLVASISRFKEGKRIAGRDFYDLHHFFTSAFDINKPVIEDLMNETYTEFIKELIGFIESNISETILREDLNPLLPPDEFNFIIGKIKPELLFFLKGQL